MSRLPVVDGDNDNWGTILNDYLLVTHKNDGTQEDDSIGEAAILDDAVTPAKINSALNYIFNNITVNDIIAKGPRVDVRAFGATGDGVADDTIPWNNCRTYARSIGAFAYIPAGVEIAVTSQLIVYDDEKWLLDGNLVRDWYAVAADKKDVATIRNEHCPDISDIIVDPGPYVPPSRNTGFTLLGTGEIKLSAATLIAVGAGNYAGPHLTLLACDNVKLGPVTLRGRCGDWATCLWGDDYTYTGLIIRDQTDVFDDGLHILGGDKHLGFVDVESGDDAIAVGSSWNLAASNFNIIAVVEAQKGHAVLLNQQRAGTAAGYATPTEKIQNIIINVVGRAGQTRNGCFLIKTSVGGEDRIDGVQINLELEHGTAGSHDKVNAYGGKIQGSHNVKIRGKLTNPVETGIEGADAVNLDIDVDCDAPQESGFRTIDLEDCSGKINGKIITNDTHAVRVDGCIIDVGAEITEIPDTYSGVWVQNGTALNFFGKARKASGATTTYAIRSASSVGEIYVGGAGLDVSDVSHTVEFAVQPAIYKQLGGRGLKKTFTIDTAAITQGGELDIDLLGEGGAADTLSTINGGQQGQRMTLRNGEADPATNAMTIDNAGNFTVAPDYILNDAKKAIVLECDGVDWHEIIRY